MYCGLSHAEAGVPGACQPKSAARAPAGKFAYTSRYLPEGLSVTTSERSKASRPSQSLSDQKPPAEAFHTSHQLEAADQVKRTPV